MVKSAFSYQVFSSLKSTFWVLQNRLKRYTTSHNSNYALVMPEKVSPTRPVPAYIQKPPYVSTTPGKDACPPYIEIQSPEQIHKIKEACSLARKILNLTAKELKVGLTTDNIDEIVHQLCVDNNVYPSPLGYLGFPKSVCTSVNNVACHGIPDSRPLQDTDIVNIDVTIYANGYHGDVSETYMIGNVDERGKKLVETTHRCLMESIDLCRPGTRFGEIGRKIRNIPTLGRLDEFCVESENNLSYLDCVEQLFIANDIAHGTQTETKCKTILLSTIGEKMYGILEDLCAPQKSIASAAGFCVVPEFCGHGIGTYFHGLPDIFHIDLGEDSRMQKGMVFTIEPVICDGKPEIKILSDGWTAITRDNSRSAQFEHCIVIVENGAEILTQ